MATYHLVEYIDGIEVARLTTADPEKATRFYMRSWHDNSCVRAYVDGERLTIPNADTPFGRFFWRGMLGVKLKGGERYGALPRPSGH